MPDLHHTGSIREPRANKHCPKCGELMSERKVVLGSRLDSHYTPRERGFLKRMCRQCGVIRQVNLADLKVYG